MEVTKKLAALLMMANPIYMEVLKANRHIQFNFAPLPNLFACLLKFESGEILWKHSCCEIEEGKSTKESFGSKSSITMTINIINLTINIVLVMECVSFTLKELMNLIE